MSFARLSPFLAPTRGRRDDTFGGPPRARARLGFGTLGCFSARRLDRAAGLAGALPGLVEALAQLLPGLTAALGRDEAGAPGPFGRPSFRPEDLARARPSRGQSHRTPVAAASPRSRGEPLPRPYVRRRSRVRRRGTGKMKRTPHHFASSIFVFSSFRCRHVSIRRFGHVTCPSQLLGW